MLLVLSMALFALEDASVRLLSARLPVGQIVATIGLLGGLVFWGLLLRQEGRLLTRDLLRLPVVVRNAGEVVGTLGFVTAISLAGLATSSAILQVLPLALVLGAAVFLGERVGWRRWCAVLIGFAGVLLILRPGLDGFRPESLFALLSVAGLAVRDLATRKMPRDILSHQLSASAFLALVPAGVVLTAVMGTPWQMPTGGEMGFFLFCAVAGVGGYAAMVLATRMGEASVIAPFRYSRLVFALILGIVFFDERPDMATLIGSAIVIGSGTFAMLRDMARARIKAPIGSQKRAV